MSQCANKVVSARRRWIVEVESWFEGLRYEWTPCVHSGLTLFGFHKSQQPMVIVRPKNQLYLCWWLVVRCSLLKELSQVSVSTFPLFHLNSGKSERHLDQCIILWSLFNRVPDVIKELTERSSSDTDGLLSSAMKFFQIKCFVCALNFISFWIDYSRNMFKPTILITKFPTFIATLTLR